MKIKRLFLPLTALVLSSCATSKGLAKLDFTIEQIGNYRLYKQNYPPRVTLVDRKPYGSLDRVIIFSPQETKIIDYNETGFQSWNDFFEEHK